MHSLNEIEALSKRAARGAGFSWGLADEAAKAVRWLCAHGLPGAASLVDLLALNDRLGHDALTPQRTDGDWAGRAGRLCPIAAGAALSDFARVLEVRESVVLIAPSQPLLLLPFAASVARQTGRSVILSYEDARLTCGCDGLHDEGLDDLSRRATVDRLRCRIADTATAALRSRDRREIPAETWGELNKYAHRTLAPATEQSRALGAGSGLGDND